MPMSGLARSEKSRASVPPPSSKVPANFPASKPRLRRDTKFVIRPDAASTGDISRASKGFAVDHGKLTPFIEKYVPSSQPPITAPVKEAMPEALPSRSRSDQSGVEKRNIYRASKSSLQISFTKSRHELADYYTDNPDYKQEILESEHFVVPSKSLTREDYEKCLPESLYPSCSIETTDISRNINTVKDAKEVASAAQKADLQRDTKKTERNETIKKPTSKGTNPKKRLTNPAFPEKAVLSLQMTTDDDFSRLDTSSSLTQTSPQVLPLLQEDSTGAVEDSSSHYISCLEPRRYSEAQFSEETDVDTGARNSFSDERHFAPPPDVSRSQSQTSYGPNWRRTSNKKSSSQNSLGSVHE